jgi:hypothetical protein
MRQFMISRVIPVNNERDFTQSGTLLVAQLVEALH